MQPESQSFAGNLKIFLARLNSQIRKDLMLLSLNGFVMDQR